MRSGSGSRLSDSNTSLIAAYCAGKKPSRNWCTNTSALPARRKKRLALVLSSRARTGVEPSTTQVTCAARSRSSTLSNVPPQPMSMSSQCAPMHRICSRLRSVSFLSPSTRMSRLLSMPDHPGTGTAGIHSIQRDLVLERVHALPEALPAVGHQFAFADQARKRLLDQFVAFLHVVENCRAQYKEAAIDPKWLLRHGPHVRYQASGVGMYGMKTLGAANADKTRDRITFGEFLDIPIQRQIRQPVGIVGQKDRFAFDVLAYSKQTLADVAVQPGINEGDTPLVQIVAVQVNLSSALAHREIVRHGLRIIEKVLAHHVAAIAQGEHKVGMAEMRVVTHQVPQHRATADVHQRLGNGVGMLTQACAETAAKQHHFHFRLPVLRISGRLRRTDRAGAAFFCFDGRAGRAELNSDAFSSSSATALSAGKPMPERWAISSNEALPSDWFRTQSMARSRSAGLRPPMAP